MTTEFQEHWLSAYLDDELSADERAQVQRRLQADPVARQLLEDLKRLRGLVSQLPEWSGTFQFDPTGLQVETAPTSISSLPPQTNLSNIKHADSDDGSDEAVGSVPPLAIRRSPRSSGGNQGARRWRPLLAIAASGIALLLAGSFLWRPWVQRLALQAPGSSVGGPIRDSARDSFSDLRNSPLERDAEGFAAPQRTEEVAAESMLAAPMSQPISEAMSAPPELLASNSKAIHESQAPAAAQPDSLAMGRSRRAAWPEWPTPPQSPPGADVAEMAPATTTPATVAPETTTPGPMAPASMAPQEIAPQEMAPPVAAGPETGLAEAGSPAAALPELPTPELSALIAPGGAADSAASAESPPALSLAAPGQLKQEAASSQLNDSANNSANNAAGQSAFQFLWARSNAWTDQDVEAELSQIEAFVPLPLRSQFAVQNQPGLQNPSVTPKSSERQREVKAAPAVENRSTDTPLITGSFHNTTPQQWFAQAQTVVPLVALPANLPIDYSYPAPNAPNLGNGDRSLRPDQSASSPTQDVPDQYFNSQSSQGVSPSKGSLILFVQQAEAERLLNMASELAEAANNRFWQIRPLNGDAAADLDPNRKVIVILNQTR